MFSIHKILLRSGVCQVRGISSKVPELPSCDFQPDKYEGKSYAETQKIRRERIAPCINALYKKPLLIHQGHMQWLFDHTGRRYLDMFGGIVTVSIGHCHPKLVDVTQKQLKKLWHTTNIYLHPNIHEYAEKLTDKLPGDLKVVYFTNSGSEANDLAMMLARLHTGRNDLISLRGSYHGGSGSTMGLVGFSVWRYNLPMQNGIHHAMTPDPYAGLWGGSRCRQSPVQTTRPCDCTGDACIASDMYLQQLEEIFKYSLPKGRVAGMFAESIQGVGGVVQYPKGYLRRAQDLVQSNGGLFIADEVQTGFGRTGDHFWGFQSHGVTPDIVTMAKGIGNGFPLAAVVTTPKIAQCLTQALHFNTFGGNPIACAVGKTVLEIIEEEKTQQLSLEIGTYLLQQLAKLQERRVELGDVRGQGLMVGVELVKEGQDRCPMDTVRMLDLMEYCKDLGLLIGRGGLHGNILRIQPPMCISKQDVDFMVQVLEMALEMSAHEKTAI